VLALGNVCIFLLKRWRCTGVEGVQERLERIKEQLANMGPDCLLRGLKFKAGPKARLQGGVCHLRLACNQILLQVPCNRRRYDKAVPNAL
jgi:hypothetical protein